MQSQMVMIKQQAKNGKQQLKILYVIEWQVSIKWIVVIMFHNCSHF